MTRPGAITPAEYYRRTGITPPARMNTPTQRPAARAAYSHVGPATHQPTTTTWAIHLTILGRPASKKNSKTLGKLFGSGKPILRESDRYLAWEREAVQQLREAWTNPPIDKPVRLAATFYEHPRQRGDLAGVMQGLCDALQAGGVLVNDRLVRAFGPTAIHRDATNPRIEVTLSSFNNDE